MTFVTKGALQAIERRSSRDRKLEEAKAALRYALEEANMRGLNHVARWKLAAESCPFAADDRRGVRMYANLVAAERKRWLDEHAERISPGAAERMEREIHGQLRLFDAPSDGLLRELEADLEEYIAKGIE